jgi:cyclopropane-fatty-acyl-phospholipid synthase
MTTYKDDSAQAAGKLTLAEILEIFTAGDDLPLKFTAYDGSSAGPADAQLGLDLLTPRGTTYLATAPGDLGFARLRLG